MSADAFDLARFVSAQAAVFPTALVELRAGTKRSHWMWFIFPQLRGLGFSSNAQFFGLAGLSEAQAYCSHDLLGERLRECTDAMLEWAGRRSSEEILGSVDALKLRSSMTLFERADPADGRFAAALDKFYAGERDAATLALLETS